MKKKINSKVKSISTHHSQPPLKLGDEVLYMSQYTIDKCSVVEIDNKQETARLSNQVLVVNKPTTTNILSKLGGTPAGTTIKLLTKETEAEYEYQVAKRGIDGITNNIKVLAHGLSKDDMILLHKKLKRIVEKIS